MNADHRFIAPKGSIILRGVRGEVTLQRPPLGGRLSLRFFSVNRPAERFILRTGSGGLKSDFCCSSQPSNAKCKIASEASTAVSVRSTRRPSDACLNPAARAKSSSPSVHPPSGPIEIAADRALTFSNTS